MRAIRTAWQALIVLVVAACDNATEPSQRPQFVVLNPSVLSMVAGDSQSLTAVPRHADGTAAVNAPVSWETSNKLIASVSNAGVVTAVGKGVAVITARSRSASGTVNVTVRARVINVLLSQTAMVIATGETRPLTVQLVDATGAVVPNAEAAWSSSSPSVASVVRAGSTGVVSGVAEGNADIIVTADGTSSSVRVRVGQPAALGGVWDWTEQRVDPTTSTVCSDTGSFVFTQAASVLTGNADQVSTCVRLTVPTLTSRSSVVSVGLASVTRITFSTFGGTNSCAYSGEINETGTTIAGTVACGASTGTWQASRGTPVASIQFVPATFPLDTVLVGATQTIRADLRNAAGARVFRRALAWQTSDAQVASVEGNPGSPPHTAQFRARGQGTARISAVFESSSASVDVTIRRLALSTIAVGGGTTCGNTVEGVLYCWASTPERNFDGPPLTSLTVGAQLGCGLDADSLAHCWTAFPVSGGREDSIPSLPGNLRFASIHAGGWTDPYYYFYYGISYSHACALTATGMAYCWGDDTFGQLGDSRTGSPVGLPLQVVTSQRFVSVSAGGMHTCALTATGQAFCWGLNSRGQLGDGTTQIRTTPVAVATTVAFTSIHAGREHTCALTAAGATWCWGANSRRALGVNAITQSTTPVMAPFAPAFASLALGADHTCGRTTAGAIYCWGADAYGQLGRGVSGSDFADPRPIGGGLAFVSVSSAAAANHTCGITADSRVYCWGDPTRLGAGQITSPAVALVLGQQ